MSEARGYKIQSIERACRILQCFKREPRLGITEISKQVGLSTSTVFGIVDTLASMGMLSRIADSNKYELGTEIFLLSLYTHRDLRTIVQPYLRRLVNEFEETANFVMHDGINSIYYDKMESPHAMRICTSIGQKIPFYASAAGRSILANLPEEAIRSAVNAYDFVPYTDKTVRDVGQLMEQLSVIRRDGYCVEKEEFEPGIFCIAVPILSNAEKNPIASISVSGPVARLNDDVQTRIITRLKEYSREISDVLGAE